MSAPLVDLGTAPGTQTAAVIAQDPPPPPGQGPEFGKASPIALVVILLLGIATVFLIRGMTKRIRRLPASFDDPGGDDPGRDDPGRDEARRAGGEKAEPPGDSTS